MIKQLLIVILGLSFFTGAVQAGTNLAGEFVTPPDSAKPWVHLWWFGTITEADITQHLEELTEMQ